MEIPPFPLASAIIRTLAYADVFQFPLKADEVFTYLIASRPFPPEEVNQTLSQLARQNVIGYSESFYFLKGHTDLVSVRQRREASSGAKWQKAYHWSRFFKVCPWVRLVGVSGALAMGNSEADDDLDLVFITSRKRLWLTRAAVVLFLFLAGQYRRPGNISGRFCPNLFLSEDALNRFEKNLFIAHEVVQLRLLWDRGSLYGHFLSQNAWVTAFLPHATKDAALGLVVGRRTRFTSFFDFLEEIAGRLQRKFMERKRTSEIVSDTILRFHPRDTTRLVLAAYEERLKPFGLSTQSKEGPGASSIGS